MSSTMALTTKLELRQSHSLVMTPQLQQAIKLLELSNIELSAFVDAELERNPLLERAEEAGEGDGEATEAAASAFKDGVREDGSEGGSETSAGTTTEAEPADGAEEDWLDLNADHGERESEALDADAQDGLPSADGFGSEALKDSGWTGLSQSQRREGGEAPNLEAYVAEERTLRDHLTDQLVLAFADPARRLIGQHLIDMADEAGYLQGELPALAELLGAPLDLVEETLAVMQGFDPCGVLARDLRECLKLQLKELDRCDPAMAILIENLHLLAAHDLAALKRLCRVSDEDLSDMLQEVKRLNPKPGLKYGASPAQPIVPDVLVRPLPEGGWHVELNSET